MNDSTLGDYLRKLRKSCGYTQEFVASHLDVTRQAYSHYENGRAIPANDTCYKIAQLYHISPDEIIQLSLPESTAPYHSKDTVSEALNGFLDYVSDSKNAAKLHHLTRKEKEVIYYFNSIPPKEQDEIIEILKIKMRK